MEKSLKHGEVNMIFFSRKYEFYLFLESLISLLAGVFEVQHQNLIFLNIQNLSLPLATKAKDKVFLCCAIVEGYDYEFAMGCCRLLTGLKGANVHASLVGTCGVTPLPVGLLDEQIKFDEEAIIKNAKIDSGQLKDKHVELRFTENERYKHFRTPAIGDIYQVPKVRSLDRGTLEAVKQDDGDSVLQFEPQVEDEDILIDVNPFIHVELVDEATCFSGAFMNLAGETIAEHFRDRTCIFDMECYPFVRVCRSLNVSVGLIMKVAANLSGSTIDSERRNVRFDKLPIESFLSMRMSLTTCNAVIERLDPRHPLIHGTENYNSVRVAHEEALDCLGGKNAQHRQLMCEFEILVRQLLYNYHHRNDISDVQKIPLQVMARHADPVFETLEAVKSYPDKQKVLHVIGMCEHKFHIPVEILEDVAFHNFFSKQLEIVCSVLRAKHGFKPKTSNARRAVTLWEPF
jgi:hypothetical protein